MSRATHATPIRHRSSPERESMRADAGSRACPRAGSTAQDPAGMSRLGWLVAVLLTVVTVAPIALGLTPCPGAAWFPSAEFGSASPAAASGLAEGKGTLSRGASRRRDERERSVIYALVQDHRRETSDAWRKRLADAVYREAVAADVDPLMVAAIVARESSFKSRAVSSAGAVGLMQLRPFVAREVARRMDIEWRGRETLHHPELNIRLGVRYYKDLVRRFDGDARKALTAYNRGPTRVSAELRRGTYAHSRYADDVLALREQLRRRGGAGQERG